MANNKIVAIDDDEILLKLLKKDLAEAGFAVITSRSSTAALGLAKRERPALILLDIHMPDMTGAEAGQAIKSDPQTQDIPIIYLTGILTPEEERALGSHIGGNLFIAKPYDPKKVLAMVQKYAQPR